MGRLTYTQTVQLLCGATPQSNMSVTRKSYQIQNPPDTLTFTDLNDSDGSDFTVPASATNFQMPTGTVENIKVIMVKPDSDLNIKIVNGNGTSQDMVFAAGRMSIWHTTGVTNILADNSTGLPITGIMFVAGD